MVRPHGALTPAEWRAAVFKRSGGRCVITGAKADDAHHVVGQQQLKRDGAMALLTEPLIGIALTRTVHFQHENAFRRIPVSALPDDVLAFVVEAGYTWYLERYYDGDA